MIDSSARRLQPSDVVTLLSGGIEMTLTKVVGSSGECCWTDQTGRPHKEVFPLSSLMLCRRVDDTTRRSDTRRLLEENHRHALENEKWKKEYDALEKRFGKILDNLPEDKVRSAMDSLGWSEFHRIRFKRGDTCVRYDLMVKLFSDDAAFQADFDRGIRGRIG